MDAAKIAELKAKFGQELYLLALRTEDMPKDAPPAEIVYRRPNEAEYAKITSEVHADGTKLVQASRELASAVVVFPEAREFSALMDRFGAIALTVAAKAKSLHLDFEVLEAKKL